MQIEVEIKIKVDNPDVIESQIRAIAELVGQDCVEDRYFLPSKESRDKKHRFRLRYDGLKSAVTFKKNDRIEYGIRDPRLKFQICEEIEYEVNDFAAFIDFAETFGFKISDIRTKRRKIYRQGRLSAELNEIEELGTFLEVEVLCEQGQIESAKEELARFVCQLDIHLGSVETRWYTSLADELIRPREELFFRAKL